MRGLYLAVCDTYSAPSLISKIHACRSSCNGIVSFSRRRCMSTASSSSQTLSSNVHASNCLKGRVCMITGASSGIGSAIARRFFLEGAEKIIVVGRNKSRLQTTLESLTKAGLPEDTQCTGTPRVNYENHTQLEGKDNSSLEAGKVENNFSEGSESECEIIDSGNFAMAIGDVGNPLFWGEKIKKTMVCFLLPFSLAVPFTPRSPYI